MPAQNDSFQRGGATRRLLLRAALALAAALTLLPTLGPASTTAMERPDSDGDGLFDDDERHAYGTDPSAWDTDGDGVDDGTEVALGTPPCGGTR